MWEQSFLKCHWVPFVVLEVYLNMKKMICRKPTFNISLNWRKPKSFFCWLNQHRVKILGAFLTLIDLICLWKHAILSNYDYKKILLKTKANKKNHSKLHTLYQLLSTHGSELLWWLNDPFIENTHQISCTSHFYIWLIIVEKIELWCSNGNNFMTGHH